MSPPTQHSTINIIFLYIYNAYYGEWVSGKRGGCSISRVGDWQQPPDSLFKGRQQSTGHLRLIAWRSTANTGVYLPLLTSSPNEHTFRGHRLPKNEKKTLSRSTADEGYQVSRRRDVAVPESKKCTIILCHRHQ